MMRRFLSLIVALFVFAGCCREKSYPTHLEARTRPLQKSRTKRWGPDYKFILFSDTHLDGAKYHPEKQNYTSPHAVMWQGKMQSMIHAAASKVDANTKFVLHAGDIMDGDRVKQPDLFVNMLTDATGYLKSEFSGVPMIILAGNHDERHLNQKRYNDFMLKYLSGEMRRQISSTTFYFMEGPDLYLCIDYVKPDLEVIRKAFREHAEARYKFVLTHAPVIPSEVWESSLFEDRPEARREFRELFMKHDVIVLCGHVHSLEYSRCETDSGRITQLLTSCVWMPQLGLDPQIKISGAEKYMKLNPKLSAKGHKLLTEYKDAITEYAVFADRNSNSKQPKIQESGAGYYILNVSPVGVEAEFYPGNTTDKPAWSLWLR